MSKFSKLISKGWFRLVILLAFASIVFVVVVCTVPNDKDTVSYVNDGSFTLASVLLGYTAILLMYLTVDTMDDMRLRVGRLMRKLLLLLSFAMVASAMGIGCIGYMVNFKNHDVIRPFFDGLMLAPVFNYAFLYVFVAGRFGDEGAGRITQFVLLLVSCLASVVAGVFIILAVRTIGNTIATILILSAVMLVVAATVVLSVRKRGLLHGSGKSRHRERAEREQSEDADAQPEKELPQRATGSTYWGDEWEETFVASIDDYPYGAYVATRTYAALLNGNINVGVCIQYYGSDDEDVRAHSVQKAVQAVRSVYRDVARRCPYSSKLEIEVKD